MTASGPHRFRRTATVIYADPDPAARRRTASELESAVDGLAVDPVATPTELRDALADADERVCVVTEYRLGETNALSLCERVRADGITDASFVLYTADGDEALASDAIATGLSGYVPKGLEDSIERLLAQIRTSVDGTGQPSDGETAVDRSQSDRERRTERDRFDPLFEHVPDAVVVVRRGETNRTVEVNPAFEALFGSERSEAADDSLEELLAPDDIESVCIADAVGFEEVVSDDIDRLTADGRKDFLRRRFAAEIDDDVYEYAIYTDISERKRRERELEQYRMLVETVGDPMYILDSTGRIEMVNDAMADALGESRAELVGRHPTDYMPAEDVKRGTETLLGILEDDERTWGTFEMDFEPDEAEPYLAENNVTPHVDDDGSLAGSVGVIRDISDRKEREKRVRLLHDGTRRLMAAKEPDEVARVVTEIACEALDLRLNSVYLYEADVGTRSTSEAATAHAAAEASVSDATAASPEAASDGLVPVAMSDRAAELFGDISHIESDGGIAWDAYEAGEAIVHGDVRRAPNVRNPDTPIRSEAHVPLGEHGIFIVSSLEVNDFDPEALTLARILAANAEAALDRAERERELAERSRELERQNDRLEAFSSTVSHDLRNPLTLASGHLDSIEEFVDDDGERHLEEIEWALERMDELVENVLTLARSGQRLTETAPVDLASVVEQAHRTVDPDLEVVCNGSLPTVEADDARLRVLFENALRNAREHVGEDVTVTIDATTDGFAIADDGPGVPPDEREAILGSGYSTAIEGTGFGLAIVSEVVEAHGWSLAVGESEAGGLRLAVSVDASQTASASSSRAQQYR